LSISPRWLVKSATSSAFCIFMITSQSPRHEISDTVAAVAD
jgi:hypothetical protein